MNFNLYLLKIPNLEFLFWISKALLYLRGGILRVLGGFYFLEWRWVWLMSKFRIVSFWRRLHLGTIVNVQSYIVLIWYEKPLELFSIPPTQFRVHECPMTQLVTDKSSIQSPRRRHFILSLELSNLSFQFIYFLSHFPDRDVVSCR